MKLLKTIYETDIGLKDKKLDIDYKSRKATRVVVFNEKNEIALIYLAKEDFYKLPGGGIDDEEDAIDALKREVLEELGITVANIKKIGQILSYRNEIQTIQTDFCFTARFSKQVQDPEYTDFEKQFDFQTKWVKIDEAFKLFQTHKAKDYFGKFFNVRDRTLIEKVKDIIDK